MDMRWVSIVLSALVGACAAPAAPRASGSASPSISAVAVTSPTSSPTLGASPTPISDVGFSCRLPITAAGPASPPGGFVDFPSATVTSDPASTRVDSIVRPGRQLLGSLDVLYYDRGYSRWLPVSRNAVSPDGTHYAYTDRLADAPSTRATLHVVNVKTGVDVAFDGGAWLTPYIAFDYGPDGLYVVIGNEAGVAALLLMNPATGDVKTVANTTNIQASAGNKVFWVGAVNPSDPNPIVGLGAEPDQIDRLNLVDGSRVPWFYRPGSAVSVIGQDLAGHPIVALSGSDGQPTEFLILLSAGTQRSIVKGLEIPARLGGPIPDSHGVWFGSPDGIFLYSDASGFEKVSSQGGYPANGCF